MILALILSVIGATGIVLILREMLTAHPRLSAALDRIDANSIDQQVPISTGSGWLETRSVRLGTRLSRYINPEDTATRMLVPSEADLALTGQPLQRVLGEQIISALLGLVFGLIFAVTMGQMMPLPAITPLILGIGLAVLLYAVPLISTRTKAAAERVEYTRTAATYLELMAIARISGLGAQQALAETAMISGHRHFRSIARIINTAQWQGRKPWDALQEEGRRLKVPALAEIGDILRLAGDSSAQVYDTLKARATTMRNTQLSDEKAVAKQETARMTLPQVAVTFLFMIGLMFPAFIRLLGS